jgi:hexulose-6-phosphate isomerase
MGQPALADDEQRAVPVRIQTQALNPIGVMQGRLSPPVDGRFQAFPVRTWRQEFSAAAAIGLQCTEWIYEAEGADQNPLATDAGLRDIRVLQGDSQVAVSSICADIFMSLHLLTEDGDTDQSAAERLEWLIGRAALVGAQHIVLPFVDASRLKGQPQIDGLVSLMSSLAPVARAAAVELHLETDLTPECLADLLARIPDDAVRANLDTGNSAALGYDPHLEVNLIGSRLGSVHVKDRVLGGGTVPLGKGSADLRSYFELLGQLSYDRPFILQAARGRSGDELNWIRSNRDYVVRLLSGDPDRPGHS